MDKCESELLEDWDIVSSVYDTEKETDVTEKNIDTGTKSNTQNSSENKTDSKTDNSNADVENNAASKTNIVAEPKPENITKAECVKIAEAEPETLTETENIAEPEPQNITKSEPENIVEAEPESIDETEPENTIEAEPHNIEAKPENIETEPENIEAEPENITDDETETITVEPENITDAEIVNIPVAETESKTVVDVESNTAANAGHYTDDNSVEDTVASTVNNLVDSSLEDIQIESCEESYVQDMPVLIPNFSEVEQENAAIESSSSDIDIIDENVEESLTSSFIPPLSLSISSSVVDTSSILSSQSEDDKDDKPQQRFEDIKREDVKSTVHTEKSYYEDKSENVRHRPRESQRTTSGRSLYDWFALFVEFFRNMSGYDWCVVGGVAISLYLTVVINQTNIFAFVEKENVVSQMKSMIDELKHDNKILKEQMLSEMKNEKAFSSFEHQIKELRKENSKLNHMLYDVAKVLEKQKNSHEKREAEYLAPFKKEINKLKEHINILKFDNEELQKQLVRMRYASYSQGGKDTSDDKEQEQRDGDIQADEDASTGEIPLDIESLRKWNDLISLLSKELSQLSGSDTLKEEKSHSETKKASPFWKDVLHEFKGTFNDFRKINISAIISDYKKANQKAVSDVYKFVKDFFTVEEEKSQKHVKPEQDNYQWKNIGDFVKDLSDKWTNIKDRLYTSDLKNFFTKNFKKAEETSHSEYHSQKAKSAAFENSESKSTNTHSESEKKHDKVQTPEDTKWMFKRAALRAELRDAEEESSVNWYLKKGKHSSEDDTEERRH